MSVGFYLKDKKAMISSIDIVVSLRGEYYRRSTGCSTLINKWNPSKQLCTITGYKHGEGVNENIKRQKKAVEDAVDHFVKIRIQPVKSEFWQEVDRLLNGGIQIDPSMTFLDYFDIYIDRIRTYRAPSTVKKFVTTFNKVTDFENTKTKPLRFQDINMRFYNEFRDFIYNQQSSSLNYFGSLIKNIKVVVREARDVDNYHDFIFVDDKRFKVEQETADSIYLTEEELLTIYRLDITPQLLISKIENIDLRPQNIQRRIDSLMITRNKFLIGAFTALRVSDFNRLEAFNFKENYIKIRTIKTGKLVTIPIHWVIREIVGGGFDIGTKMSEQRINDQIKVLARLAGITGIEECTKSVKGKRVSFSAEKCDLISTHTARRSGATNMVKSGMNPLLVMKITGHTKWSTFMKYVRLSEDENFQLMWESGYFNKPEKILTELE